MRSGLVTALLIAAAAFAAVAVGCGSDPEQKQRPLRIYASQPLQGARGGWDTVRAIRIAVANAGGEIEGAPVEVVVLDDSTASGSYDPVRVAANARKAAADPRAIAYIGEFDSGATKIAMPILNEAGILQVSSRSTAVGLTRGTAKEELLLQPTRLRTFARVVPNDTIQAAALAAFMEEESVDSVYIVNDGGAYGTGLDQQFTAVAPSTDIEVLGSTTVRESTSLPSLAAKVDRSNADAVLFAGADIERALVVLGSIHDADVNIKLFGGDGLTTQGFTRELGDLELDTYLTAPVLPPGNYARSGEAFLSNFEERFGRPPEAMAVFGYEAGSAIMGAMRQAARSDNAEDEPIAELRRATRDAFFDIRERPSPLGSYSIDEYGDTTLSFYGAYRVENGRLTLGRALNIPPTTLQEPPR